MRIGIDARMYRSSVAGIGRYSQNLIKNLLDLPAGKAGIDREDEFILFMTDDDYREFKNAKAQMSNAKQNPNVKIQITNIAHFSVAEQTKFGKIIENEKLDLMHFLNFNYPVRYRGKFIITIHDLTLYFYPDTAKKSNILKRNAFKYVMKSGCQNALKILADSQSTKNDIIKVFKTPSNKIDVIYFAADDKTFANIDSHQIDALKHKYNINQPVILCVSQFRPHKNLPSLIEAFDLIKKDLDCKLVFLGKPDPKHHRFTSALDNSPNKRDIIMPGFVCDEELAAWYKVATVFCFPSLYEGFGLPGLEAMMAGTAVVSSNTSSLPEIYSDAALYFDPFKIQDIADKLKVAISNEKLRLSLIEKGKIQANKYSWKKTAEETLKIYKSI